MADRAASGDRRASHAVLGLGLAWVAGFVDAAGFLLLAHLFTAHMSGNSAAMGAYFGQGSWREAIHRATPIPFFVAGVGAGAALAEVAWRRAIRSPLTVVLCVQAALLALLMLAGARLAASGAYALAVSVPSFAMGLQNATIRRVGSASIRTTFVSGVLCDFAENVVAWLFLMRDDDAGAGRSRLAQAAIYATIWLAFAVGAICGSVAAGRWSFHAFVIPVAVLAVIAAWDLVWPLTSFGEVAPAKEACGSRAA